MNIDAASKIRYAPVKIAHVQRPARDSQKSPTRKDQEGFLAGVVTSRVLRG